MVDIVYMKLEDGKFFNVKELDEIWDNSYFMREFDNISDFVSNEVNLLDVEEGIWPVNPFVMILDGDDISIILDYLENEKILISDDGPSLTGSRKANKKVITFFGPGPK